jgi:transcriptional regulator with XRE-family HTH domain
VETTKQRLLREAATLMGRRELAQRLKVSDAQLDEWISGTGKMPDRKLLVLADVLDIWAGRQSKPAKTDLKPAA